MLRFLNILGPLKWPSALAISILPVASFYLYWRDDEAVAPVALYGPALVGPVAVLLSHPADADVLNDPEIEWTLRLCRGCAVWFKHMAIAYGGNGKRHNEWVRFVDRVGQPRAKLPRASLTPGEELAVWLELHGIDGKVHRHTWSLVVLPRDGRLRQLSVTLSDAS